MRPVYPNELMHYGILGMKWGVRRYQNPDGTLTEAGRSRYGTIDKKTQKKNFKKVVKDYKKGENLTYSNPVVRSKQKRQNELDEQYSKYVENEKNANAIFEKFMKTLPEGTDYKEADPLFSKYLKENSRVANEYDKAQQRAVDAYHAIEKIGQEIAEETLGKYINKGVFTGHGTLNGKRYKEYANMGAEIARSITSDNLWGRELQSHKLLESAKKNDSYSIDYLERISEELSGYKNKGARLKDYEKYLFNPTKWEADRDRTSSANSGSKHENAKKNAKNVTSMEDIDIDYQNYKDEHPGTKMSIEDFQDWYYDFD